jgi:hypothetical protein
MKPLMQKLPNKLYQTPFKFRFFKLSFTKVLEGLSRLSKPNT